MQFIINKKTTIKVLISTILLIGIFFVFMIIPAIFTQSIEIILFFTFFGFLVITFIIAHYYPKWFKDYIKEFWAKQNKE